MSDFWCYHCNVIFSFRKEKFRKRRICCGMERKRGWQGMDLMGDLLEPSNNMDPLFTRCSPKSSPTTPATTNITFLSSLESPKTVAADINLNKQKNSPDFNQNKAQVPLTQTKLSRMDRHISNRLILFHFPEITCFHRYILFPISR